LDAFSLGFRLQVSRSLGDFKYKKKKGLPPEAQAVQTFNIQAQVVDVTLCVCVVGYMHAGCAGD
jgi:hypothetical protein